MLSASSPQPHPCSHEIEEKKQEINNNDTISMNLEWKIPSMCYNKKQILCDGFVRINYLNKYITRSIIQLIVNYYTNDPFTLNDIIDDNIKQQHKFSSQILSIYGLKWYLSLEYIDNKIFCIAHLIAFPKKKVYQFKLLYSSKGYLDIDNYTKQEEKTNVVLSAYSTRLRTCILDLDDFKNNNNIKFDKHQLSVSFNIEILAAFDTMHNNNLSKYIVPYIHQTKQINLPFAECIWNITDPVLISTMKQANNSTYFISNIYKFGEFKVCLKFYPNTNGDNSVLYLSIITWPDDIDCVSVHGRLFLKETNTDCFIRDRLFTKDSNTWGWRNDKLKFDETIKLKQLTMSTQFTIHQVYEYIINNDNHLRERQVIPNYVEDNIATQKLNINGEFAKKEEYTFYEWKISDLNVIDYKSDDHIGIVFAERVIKIGPLIWCLSFVPNPNPKDDRYKKSILFQLSLSYFPKETKKISIVFRSKVEILNEYRNLMIWFDKRHTLLNWPISVENFDVSNLHQIIWNICIQIADIEFNDNIDKKNYKYLRNCYLSPTIKINTIETDYNFMDIYCWNIDDEKLIKHMKNAKNVESFTSDIFILCGLKWYLSFYPNASNSKRKGTYNIFLKSVGILDNKSSYFVKWEIEFVQVNVKKSGYWMVNKENNNRGIVSGMNHPQKFEELLDLKQFTFIVKLTMIDNIGIDNNLDVNNTSISTEMDIYFWNINGQLMDKMKCAKNGEIFESDRFMMFGMKWYLSCYPDGDNKDNKDYVILYINNTKLPFIDSVLSIKYTLNVFETNTRLNGCGYFDNNNRNMSWGGFRISKETFKLLQTFTVKLELTLIDTFKCDYHVQCNYNKQLKHDDDDKFKMWLCNKVGLSKYYHLFVENGFDNLNIIKFLNIDDLKNIGIEDKGHRVRISLDIALLNLQSI